jgi:Tol biopolymer transport system component
MILIHDLCTQRRVSGWSSDISADGRYVVFESDASNLVPGDTNNGTDIFLRDMQAGTTELISVDSTGAQLPTSSYPSVSVDGRYVAFHSGFVMVRDRVTKQTATISKGFTELGPIISADGRFVAFNSWGRVFVFDRMTGRRELVSRTYNGDRVNANAYPASISGGYEGEAQH